MKWKLRVKHSYWECLRHRINTPDFIIAKKGKATFIEIYYIIIFIIIIIIITLKWSQNPLKKGEKITPVKTRYLAKCISNINFISSKAIFRRIIM